MRPAGWSLGGGDQRWGWQLCCARCACRHLALPTFELWGTALRRFRPQDEQGQVLTAGLPLKHVCAHLGAMAPLPLPRLGCFHSCPMHQRTYGQDSRPLSAGAEALVCSACSLATDSPVLYSRLIGETLALVAPARHQGRRTAQLPAVFRPRAACAVPHLNDQK